MKKSIMIVFACAAFFSSGSSTNSNTSEEIEFKNHAHNLNDLQNGDIILRCGKGFISNVFRNFSFTDKRFSHAGIISIEQHRAFVYNMNDNAAGQMKRESIENFIKPQHCSEYAVFRYSLKKEQQSQMMNKLYELYKKKIKFDKVFDLSSDSMMYCTELIYKLVNSLSPDAGYIPVSQVNGKRYVAADNLFLNSHATLVCTSIYK